MAANAGQVIVVADSSKLGKSDMCKVFEPKNYNLIITNSGIDKDAVRNLTKHNINIELA